MDVLIQNGEQTFLRLFTLAGALSLLAVQLVYAEEPSDRALRKAIIQEHAVQLQATQKRMGKASAPVEVILSNIVADCSWKPGAVVAAFKSAGGSGVPVSWALQQPGTDFAISPVPPITSPTATVSVGPKGIAPANCGVTESITVEATQP